ncbi:protein C19orf12 homolog isoform X1 [Paramormyrops kingsleyae]|nr:protein C19orf12 homolog isoform X1 [Paramormyrops kingsleyae]
MTVSPEGLWFFDSSVKVRPKIPAENLFIYTGKRLSKSDRMPPCVDDVMQLCCKLSTNWAIKTAMKNSLKGAMIAGGSALLGGLVLGPAGIAVGGAVGGSLGYWNTRGEFKPLPQIIMQLSMPEQQKLYADIKAVLGSLDWMDAAQLTSLVMGNAVLQQQVKDALLGYVTQTLQAEVQFVD